TSVSQMKVSVVPGTTFLIVRTVSFRFRLGIARSYMCALQEAYRKQQEATQGAMQRKPAGGVILDYRDV
ncbi:MAG: hypothetical protein O7A68_04420, partial [Alphaproteobacteria bacterium]|nr:hypothetical protein [Alphaproteobacteria bacterium]